ncbi:MAG TPA: DUF3866 family protein [Actinomycetes bacterium]|nr:DUF3866 family protein [Actinomycetes bacterium]
MIRWRVGTVTAVRQGWSTALELDVGLAAARGEPLGGTVTVRALAYTDLVGRPEVGDQVLLNTSALDLELGTGGYAMVVAIPDRLPPDPQGPGHLIKARYTPMQSTVLGVDEQESPHHELLRDADDLDGMPVVVADLHSALPAILAGLRQAHPGARVVYVATDGGALPLAFSRTVSGLVSAGWLSGTATVGQAFGGDVEAVTVHNGLLAAKLVLGADVAVVTQGPGNLGTGTRWGFSGVAAGEAVNAAGVLGGHPIASLRISQADERERHFGISHHSRTAYGRVAMVAADLPVPDFPDNLGPAGFAARVAAQAEALTGLHRLVVVELEGLSAALDASPVPLSTMGRGMTDDPAAFLAAAAAGRRAADVLGSAE